MCMHACMVSFSTDEEPGLKSKLYLVILGKLFNFSVSVYTTLKWNDHNYPRRVAKFLTYYMCSVMLTIIIISCQYI